MTNPIRRLSAFASPLGLGNDPLALLGREAEQTQLAGLLEAARVGTSGVLVLEGEPGIGKSSLLSWAISRPEGFRIIATRGMESEIELPYGRLGLLLAPLDEFLDILDLSYRDALTTFT